MKNIDLSSETMHETDKGGKYDMREEMLVYVSNEGCPGAALIDIDVHTPEACLTLTILEDT